MRQRVMLAMGFSNEPALLIADEPTTALDVTIQAQILDLLRELNADLGTAVILISHDLGVIANVCSRVLVMYAGEVVEEGAPEDLLTDPRHPYTWALLHAAPRLDRASAGDRRLTTIEGQPPDPRDWPDRLPLSRALSVRDRRNAPSIRSCCRSATDRARALLGDAGAAARCTPPRACPRGGRRRTRRSTPAAPLLEVARPGQAFPAAAREFLRAASACCARSMASISTCIAGETVGLVGESGCGKSTLARAGDARCTSRPRADRLRRPGHHAHASQAEIRPLRRRMQMIFQDPYASLNPRMTVGEILGRSAAPARHRRTMRRQPARGSRELLDLVGLPPTAAARFPHEFSGGQRQRISIARALAVEPDFIVADEPISALDVNIQAQIINLMIDLQERLGLTYLFIAHDLAVVRHICDRIVGAVSRQGDGDRRRPRRCSRVRCIPIRAS